MSSLIIARIGGADVAKDSLFFHYWFCTQVCNANSAAIPQELRTMAQPRKGRRGKPCSPSFALQNSLWDCYAPQKVAEVLENYNYINGKTRIPISSYARNSNAVSQKALHRSLSVPKYPCNK